MAKAKKAKERTIQVIDIIDYLTEKLTEETGIQFERDAWENAAPEEYGVVELGKTVAEQWADGRLIDSVYAVTATLYVQGCDNGWVETMQGILEQLREEEIITSTWSLGRAYLMDIGKTRWEWNLRVYGPLKRTVSIDG